MALNYLKLIDVGILIGIAPDRLIFAQTLATPVQGDTYEEFALLISQSQVTHGVALSDEWHDVITARISSLAVKEVIFAIKPNPSNEFPRNPSSCW